MRDCPTKSILNQNQIQELIDNYRRELGPVEKLDRDKKFTFALTLLQSKKESDVLEGVNIISDLCINGIDMRDFYYYLSLGWFRLANDRLALTYIEHLLNFEPENRQAKELKSKIKRKMKLEDIYTVAAISTSAVVLVGAVATGVFFLFKL